MALQRLSPSARAVFDADAVDATRSHRFRLRRMRQAQRLTGLLLDQREFGPLVGRISQNFKTKLFYTREAVGMLQTVTEHHMIGLMDEATQACIHDKRAVVCPKDVNLARRLRKEFDAAYGPA